MTDFPGGLVAKTAPSAGGAGSITGQETRSCMPQPRVPVLKLKITHATTKIRRSQINNNNNNKKSGSCLSLIYILKK